MKILLEKKGQENLENNITFDNGQYVLIEYKNYDFQDILFLSKFFHFKFSLLFSLFLLLLINPIDYYFMCSIIIIYF